jgi:hypothetical protein
MNMIGKKKKKKKEDCDDDGKTAIKEIDRVQQPPTQHRHHC